MIGSRKEIYQAKYVEEYTPDGGQVYTKNTVLGVGKRLKRALFSLDADGTVSFETEGGDTITAKPYVGKLTQTDFAKKITAIATATKVYIHHNGELETSGRETAPTTQASSITFDNVAATEMDVDFTDGSGVSRILVARSGGAVNASPSNKTTYSADAEFGEGDEIGTGNFVVGVGSGPFSITGLTTATTYHFRVFEFRGSAGQEVYNTDTATGNPASQITS